MAVVQSIKYKKIVSDIMGESSQNIHHRALIEYESEVIKPTIQEAKDFFKILSKHKILKSTITIKFLRLSQNKRRYLNASWGILERYPICTWSYALTSPKDIFLGTLTFDLHYRDSEKKHFLKVWIQVGEIGREISYFEKDPNELVSLVLQELVDILEELGY